MTPHYQDINPDAEVPWEWKLDWWNEGFHHSLGPIDLQNIGDPCAVPRSWSHAPHYPEARVTKEEIRQFEEHEEKYGWMDDDTYLRFMGYTK